MNIFPINYNEPVFRPPSEGQSILIQVTIGCSHNLCTYCDMYRSKSYRQRSISEVEKDLYRLARFYRSSIASAPSKLFFCDGDALGADQDFLLECLILVKKYLPWIRRVGSYATVTNILQKSLDELIQLQANGLEIAYLGLETGHDPLLKRVVKDCNQEQQIKAMEKLKEARIKNSTIVMIGLGGVDFLETHPLDTAKVLRLNPPEFLSFLITRPVPGTPYYKMASRKQFRSLSEKQCFEQMYVIIKNFNTANRQVRTIFRANHVSNFYPISGTLPKDQMTLLTLLEQLINKAGTSPLPLHFNGPM